MANSKVVSTGMCFEDVSQALQKQDLPDPKYFKDLLAHFGGVRHEEDSDTRGTISDEIANSLRQSAILTTYEAFDQAEVDLSEHLLSSALQGNLQEVISTYETLKTRQDLLIEPLTFVAAKSGQAEVFKFCFHECIKRDIGLDMPITCIMLKVPEILDFLYEQNWQNIQNSPKFLKNSGYISCCYGPFNGANKLKVLKWLMKHGVKMPRDMYNPYAAPSYEVMSYLIEQNPKGILENGLLQIAAGDLDLKQVTFLLDAGANVNQSPANLSNDPFDGEGPYTALYMAVNARLDPEVEAKSLEKKLEMIKLLLGRGADVNKPRGPGRLKTGPSPLQRARELGQPEVLDLFEDFAAKKDEL